MRTLIFLLIPKISLTHNLIHYTYMIDNILFSQKSQYFIFKKYSLKVINRLLFAKVYKSVQ